MRKFCYILLLCTTVLTACSVDTVYSRFVPVSSAQWHIDSTVYFNIPVTDTTFTYRTIIYVRHTERYPYQNMWLFVGDNLHRDTIEFYLADDRGQWLGDTHNGFIEMPVLIDENRQFADTGTYHIAIQHAMRDTLLRGITDIGIEMIRNGKK